jgi:5-methylcytosine-specific restriction protein A
MPSTAPRPCGHAGCGAAVSGARYCPAHVAEARAGRFADPYRGSRQSRGYGAAWDRLRRDVMARDHGLCQTCRREDNRATVARDVDHRVPKAEGGSSSAAGPRRDRKPGGAKSLRDAPRGPDVWAYFLAREIVGGGVLAQM